VALATRDLGDRAGRQLPQAWTNAVTDAAMPPGNDLGDALGKAIVGTSLRQRDPFWWTAFGFVQWVLVMTAAIGASWLIVVTLLDWLRLAAVNTPSLGPLPYPFLLFVGGLFVGFLVSLLTGALGRVGGRRRKALVAGRLNESVAQAARGRLVAPVQEILDRHRQGGSSSRSLVSPPEAVHNGPVFRPTVHRCAASYVARRAASPSWGSRRVWRVNMEAMRG
jgi:hypothetical protein